MGHVEGREDRRLIWRSAPLTSKASVLPAFVTARSDYLLDDDHSVTVGALLGFIPELCSVHFVLPLLVF